MVVSTMTPYYPAFLDIKGRACTVIGGGEVAERKVRFLLECGGRVTLISPEATEGLEELSREGRIIWRRRPYQEGDLAEAFLAIAATDDNGVNRQVSAEAKRSKVLLNVVDVPPLCDFIAPSIVRRGDVIVATSTGGTAPALARTFREKLSLSRILEYADLGPLLAQARGELRRRGVHVEPDHWQECITEELLDMVQQGRDEEALTSLLAHLEEGTLEAPAHGSTGLS